MYIFNDLTCFDVYYQFFFLASNFNLQQEKNFLDNCVEILNIKDTTSSSDILDH